jgi:Domain of unknown function (DUF5615)
MKFLIDAQLPRRLATQLQQAGFEATHTLDLPNGNRTTDQALITLSLAEEGCHYQGLGFRPVASAKTRAVEIITRLNW